MSIAHLNNNFGIKNMVKVYLHLNSGNSNPRKVPNNVPSGDNFVWQVDSKAAYISFVIPFCTTALQQSHMIGAGLSGEKYTGILLVHAILPSLVAQIDPLQQNGICFSQDQSTLSTTARNPVP